MILNEYSVFTRPLTPSQTDKMGMIVGRSRHEPRLKPRGAVHCIWNCMDVYSADLECFWLFSRFEIFLAQGCVAVNYWPGAVGNARSVRFGQIRDSFSEL